MATKEVFTPAEAAAFNEGFNDAVAARFSDSAQVASNSALTPDEANAYFEGVEAGKAKFSGIVYLGAADCPSCETIRTKLVPA